jgi:hypothetical protein
MYTKMCTLNLDTDDPSRERNYISGSCVAVPILGTAGGIPYFVNRLINCASLVECLYLLHSEWSHRQYHVITVVSYSSRAASSNLNSMLANFFARKATCTRTFYRRSMVILLQILGKYLARMACSDDPLIRLPTCAQFVEVVCQTSCVSTQKMS